MITYWKKKMQVLFDNEITLINVINKWRDLKKKKMKKK